jgi:hypothetical protein
LSGNSQGLRRDLTLEIVTSAAKGLLCAEEWFAMVQALLGITLILVVVVAVVYVVAKLTLT